MIMTSTFWKSTVEVAIKAAAAAALGVIGANELLSVAGVDWTQVGGVAVLAAIVSVLTAIVAPNPDVRAARKEAQIRAARVAAEEKAAAEKAATPKRPRKAAAKK
jgi:hypothetical protein